jgi:uncharacterized Zn-binding protein involved in type VI secretion
MAATVCVNGMTVVHKTSGGTVCFSPDVCLTPAPPGAPVPVPYPNIAQSRDTDKGSKTVKIDGNPVMVQGSVFSKSTGDESGSCGGVASGVTKGKAEFINFSFDVKIEGKCVPRLGDQMIGNIGGSANTPPMAELQPPIVVLPDHYTEADMDKLTVVLVYGNGQPIKDERYILKKPDGVKIEGKTDGQGRIHVEKTISGLGKIIFPDLKEGGISIVS